MNITKAVAFFGNKSALARATGVKPPSVTRWSQGEPPDDYHQFLIQKLTGGAVKVDPEVLKKWKAVW